MNNVVPGPILTDGGIQAMGSQEVFEQLVRSVPLGFTGEPRDVTHAVVYLASDATRFVTGTTLTVDGGRSVGGYDVPG